jgi:hypothetical protein
VAYHQITPSDETQVGAFKEQTKGFQRGRGCYKRRGSGDLGEEAYLWIHAAISRISYIGRKNMY